MSIYLPPWQRTCDCCCPCTTASFGVTYDDPGCACAVTCATQPLTLLADRWDYALFLDPAGDLWHVPAQPDGAWAWENTGEIDSRSEFYDASVTIEHLLRTAAHVLANTPPDSVRPRWAAPVGGPRPFWCLRPARRTAMYRTPRPAYDRRCDCTCPIHHGQPRAIYDDPGCHCLTSCASQPLTLLAPQINGALFLDRHELLWYVPGLEPGH
jgi:hypothetical protein